MVVPFITLVIPAYNEESLLPALLESIRISVAEWAQGAGSVEVIVADNCSTDRTSEIARRSGARVVNVPVRGIGAARNGGAAAAHGHVLCFVDADSHPSTELRRHSGSHGPVQGWRRRDRRNARALVCGSAPNGCDDPPCKGPGYRFRCRVLQAG